MSATKTAVKNNSAALKFLVENAPAIEAELCGRSLSEFTCRAWPIIEPGREYMHNWHIGLICEYLTAVSRHQIKRLGIEVEPRCMKSICVSVMWPCWDWTQDPTARFMFASHSLELSTKHSTDRRTIISSPWYQERWGDKVQLAADNNEKRAYTNTAMGSMRATAVGAGVTGFGGNRLVVDDLVAAIHGDSQLIREAANTFFDRSLFNRLDNKKQDTIVVIMQRLHEDDLIGHIQATREHDDWVFLTIPTEAEQDERLVFPISGQVIERKEGDLLWPEREGPAEIAAAKERLGSYGYAAQYQQRPVPREGGMFHRDWFKIVDQVPAHMECQARHWDLAATEPTPGRDPDYTASARVGLADGRYYITSVDRDRLSPLGVEQLVKQWAQVDGQRVAITMEQEPGSSGVNTIDHYARVVLVGYNFHGVRTTGSKVERALVMAAAAEAGNVYLLKGAWNEAFLDEVSVAPMGRHDDQWDAAAGAINDLAQPTNGGSNG